MLMRLNLQFTCQKSEDEIAAALFPTDLRAASSQDDPLAAGRGTNDENEWCDLSNRRLFYLLLRLKPAGINKHWNLGHLVNFMNHVYSSEDPLILEMFLSSYDLALCRSYQENHGCDRKEVAVFKPRYSIRPDRNAIMARLSTMWRMKTVEENERQFEVTSSELLLKKEDFRLPTWIIEEAEKYRSTSQAPAAESTSSESPLQPPAKKRRRQLKNQPSQNEDDDATPPASTGTRGRRNVRASSPASSSTRSSTPNLRR